MKIHISLILKYESHSRQISRGECETHAIESALTSSPFSHAKFSYFLAPTDLNSVTLK